MKHFGKKPCYYCGSEIETVGIDRVDNKIGYEFDNCVPCCGLCNKMKNSYNSKKFVEHCKKISFYLKKYLTDNNSCLLYVFEERYL